MMTGSISLQFLMYVLLSLLAKSLLNIFFYFVIRKFSYWTECRVYILDQTGLKKKGNDCLSLCEFEGNTVFNLLVNIYTCLAK